MIKSIFIKQFFILSILACLIVCSDDTVDPTNNSDGDSKTDRGSNTDGNSGTCGDGVIDTDEACDDGGSNSDTLKLMPAVLIAQLQAVVIVFVIQMKILAHV